MHLVIVKWTDSCSKSGWVLASEVKEFHKAPLIENVGFVVEQDKDGITLTQGVSENSYAGLFFIPVEAIRKITKVKY